MSTASAEAPPIEELRDAPEIENLNDEPEQIPAPKKRGRPAKAKAEAKKSAPKTPKTKLPPLLQATDALTGWVAEHGTGPRNHGQLNEAEWKELVELDEAFGEQLRKGAPGNSLPERPGGTPQGVALSESLPYCNLCYRWVPGSPGISMRTTVVTNRTPLDEGKMEEEIEEATAIVEGSKQDPRWWMMYVDRWLVQMKRFRADSAAMK